MTHGTLFSILILGVLAGCSGREPASPLSQVACPAGADSGEPGFTHLGDDLALYWQEPFGAGHRLLYSRLASPQAFGEPREAASGSDWFVNWADRASVNGGEGALLAAHWLAKSDTATYAYDVWARVSGDGGGTWTDPVRLHSDGTLTEHGFATFLPVEGGFRVVWLDGRETGGGEGHGEGGHGGGGAMTLRTAMLDASGAVTHGALLDGRVCDCCPTDAVAHGDAQVVVYRDRSDAEIRDIYTVRYAGGAWSEPSPVHDDGWRIHGCPVNGPALASSGDLLVCAWYTAPEESARVNVALSRDGGRSFEPPVRVDGGAPLGRVDVEAVEDGVFVVTWMEEVPSDTEEPTERARIQARVLFPQGKLGDPVTLTETADSRAVGFPRLARHGTDFYVAWTEVGEEENRVRVLRWSPQWMRL